MLFRSKLFTRPTAQDTGATSGSSTSGGTLPGATPPTEATAPTSAGGTTPALCFPGLEAFLKLSTTEDVEKYFNLHLAPLEGKDSDYFNALHYEHSCLSDRRF